jgi:hypothetical protein
MPTEGSLFGRGVSLGTGITMVGGVAIVFMALSVPVFLIIVYENVCYTQYQVVRFCYPPLRNMTSGAV